MVDGARARGGVPGWYWLVAGGALLFELAGCYAFYLQLTVDSAGLPADQRALAEATPMWMLVAYGLAVVSGLVGAVALLQRRKFSKGALLLSLVAVLVQFGGILLVPALRQSTSSDDLLVPILIILVAYGLWQFAKLARRRGWVS